MEETARRPCEAALWSRNWSGPLFDCRRTLTAILGQFLICRSSPLPYLAGDIYMRNSSKALI
jgi:hypothetical protein